MPYRKVEITPEMRLDAYVWALLVLERVIEHPLHHGVPETNSICYLLNYYVRQITNDIYYSVHYNRSDFPEFFALKPANRNFADYWFNRRYTRPRIRLLKKAIKMVGKI